MCKRFLAVSEDADELKAAKELGISRCYLHRLLNQLNVAEAAEEEAELLEVEEDGADAAELQEDAVAPAPPLKTGKPAKVFRSAIRIA